MARGRASTRRHTRPAGARFLSWRGSTASGPPSSEPPPILGQGHHRASLHDSRPQATDRFFATGGRLRRVRGWAGDQRRPSGCGRGRADLARCLRRILAGDAESGGVTVRTRALVSAALDSPKPACPPYEGDCSAARGALAGVARRRHGLGATR